MELVIHIDPRLTEHELLEATNHIRREFYFKTGINCDKVRIYATGVGIFPTVEGYDMSNIGRNTWKMYLAGAFAEPQASINDRERNHS